MRRLIICATFLLLVPRPDASTPHRRALVFIDHTAPVTAARLLDEGVAVLRDLDGALIALATPSDFATLDRFAPDYQIVDDDAAAKTFYLVAPARRARTEDEREIAPPTHSGRVKMTSRFGDIVEATPEEADGMAAAGAQVARVFMTPMRAAKVDKPAPRAAPSLPDSLILAMADSVSGPTIDATIQRLQDFGNRYALGDSVDSARDWIIGRFESFGVDTVWTEEFDVRFGETVIAAVYGVGHPDKIVLIGGHYDSTAPGGDPAPGADDNASGTTCVLECARVLSSYEFDYTVLFVAFCGEEQGLVGSEAYAAAAAARGDDIVAMINVDMIGYLSPGDPLDIDVVSNAGSKWLRDLLMQVRALYVPGLPAIDGALPANSNSDHASFWRHGFDAVMFWEDTNHYNPYIHTPADTVGRGYNSPALALGSTRVAAALTATLAEPFRVVIQHDAVTLAEDTQSAVPVDAVVLSNRALNPDSLFVRYTTIDGAVPDASMPAPIVVENEVPLVSLGHDDLYEAMIPPRNPGTIVDYYIVAETADGYRAVDPKGAPAVRHRFVFGQVEIVFEDDFEMDHGWTVGVPDDDATDGFWVRERPNLTRTGATIVQPDYDHGADPDSICFVTANAPPGEISMGFKDVDKGKTTLLSPVFDLSAHANVWFSYYRWYTNDTEGSVDDEWTVDVSNDGGATWKNVETLATSARVWTRVGGPLRDFVEPTDAVQFRFVAADRGGGSIVEALVDDFALVDYTGSLTHAGDSPPRATLGQNYPNPFNPGTTIRVTAPNERVTVRVYDVAGRLVATLLDHELVAGERLVPWDGTNRNNSYVASGVYFVRLTTPSTTLTRKMVVLR